MIQIFHGWGFPSSSQALVLFRYKRSDRNGYYDLFDLDPQCSMEEIKNRFRELAKKCHPDGEEPDPELFDTVKKIYDVLSNPLTRQEYNGVPEGKNYIGAIEKENIFKMARDKGVSLSDHIITPDKVKTNQFYDFFADDIQWSNRVSLWYDHLLTASYLYRYAQTIRIGIDSLDTPVKVTNKIGYKVFWFDKDIEPNFITAFTAISLISSFSWKKDNKYKFVLTS